MSLEAAMPWLIAAGMLLAGFVAIRVIMRIMKRAIAGSSLDAALHKFIQSGTQAVCWVILSGTVLAYLGVPLSTFITMLGVSGAAIALALKDSLGNIAGGVIIMVSQPFKQGDLIEAGGAKGTVEGIDLLLTTLLTQDDNKVYIPNGTLSKSVIVNYSQREDRAGMS